jgi:hypothetical protein
VLRRGPLSEPVAEAGRRDDVKHLPRDVTALFEVELGQFLVEAIDLREKLT